MTEEKMREALEKIEQRCNEANIDTMGLLDAIHAIAGMARAALTKQEAGEVCGAGTAAFDDIEKAAMRLALKRCGEQFRFYEREHLAKAAASQWNGMTASAVASSNKAETNAAMAVMCEALLTEAGEVSRSQTAQALEEAATIADDVAEREFNKGEAGGTGGHYWKVHAAEEIAQAIRALSRPAPDAGWREALEEAAKLAELFLSLAKEHDMDPDTFGALVANGTLPEQIRALSPLPAPPVGEGK